MYIYLQMKVLKKSNFKIIETRELPAKIDIRLFTRRQSFFKVSTGVKILHRRKRATVIYSIRKLPNINCRHLNKLQKSVSYHIKLYECLFFRNFILCYYHKNDIEKHAHDQREVNIYIYQFFLNTDSTR